MIRSTLTIVSAFILNTVPTPRHPHPLLTPQTPSAPSLPPLSPPSSILSLVKAVRHVPIHQYAQQ